jgi:hypothetical protein
MAFKQIIKGTLLPKVPLKELTEADNSAGSDAIPYVASDKYPSRAERTGAVFPFVKIAGQIVKNIEMMTIDETGFIPTVTLVFNDSFGEFGGDYFPKTDVIMSTYIKVGSDKLKPIRCDFLITSIKSMPAKYSGKRVGISKDLTYTVKGELYVPGIYENISKSYAKLNSKDALKAICTKLSLGFAENESTPNDKMTWINVNMSTLNFMKSILEHAYQDDDSFFTGFIDKYYYLNYIEVNKQLLADEADQTFLSTPLATQKGFNQKVKDDPRTAELEEISTINYLTTEIERKGATNYIIAANLISEQGEVLKKQGYQKNIYYYDHLKSAKEPKEKFKDFYVEGLKSIDRDQNLFLVPEDEKLASHRIKKWMNIDYGNAHPEWNAARLINSHNLKELDKIKLRVALSGINFQAIRGSMIPVMVTVQRAENILKATEELGSEKDLTKDDRPDATTLADQVIDEQLTGYYYIKGAKYHYDINHPGGFYTEFFLARREWKPSKK